MCCCTCLCLHALVPCLGPCVHHQHVCLPQYPLTAAAAGWTAVGCPAVGAGWTAGLRPLAVVVGAVWEGVEVIPQSQSGSAPVPAFGPALPASDSLAVKGAHLGLHA